MSKLRVLSAAHDLGILTLLFKEGLITSKVQMQWEYYLQVYALMKINGGKKRQAVEDVSIKVGVSISTIWRALESLEEK